MRYPILTDPKELADFIENTGQLMLRPGGHNVFHKLREEEVAVILAALRAYTVAANTSRGHHE